MKPLIVILGPTATGKTSLAKTFCKNFNGEIVSADSRQIYKELDIGSGRGSPDSSKVRIEEDIWIEEGVPIHLYNLISPGEKFTVVKYAELARKALHDIWGRGKTPFLVGGTGFYISAVLGDVEIEPIPPNPSLRKELEDSSLTKLQDRLKELDEDLYSEVDENNPHRLIRAIERASFIKEHPEKEVTPIPTLKDEGVEPLKIGLNAPRDVLYERIDKRTDSMMEDGLLDEVKLLLLKYGPEAPALNAIGYRQFAPHLLGEADLEEAVENKKNSEHAFARRQLTWFRRDEDIKWYDITEENFDQEIEKLVESYLKGINNG